MSALFRRMNSSLSESNENRKWKVEYKRIFTHVIERQDTKQGRCINLKVELGVNFVLHNLFGHYG
jgi:hypothetical protein